MRRETRTVTTTIAFLALVAIGSTGTLLVGFTTYTNFVNPYSYVPASPASSIEGMGMTPIANYTVVFVLDGVRTDVFYETSKPGISSMSGWANYTNTRCSTLLSVSRAGYGVISSGTNTAESQVISNDHLGEFPADSIWNTTLRHSGTTAVVGGYTWWELFNPWLNYSLTFTEVMPGSETVLVNSTSGNPITEITLPDYRDSLVSSYAAELVENYQPNFTIVHFSETDEAGHVNGSLSQSYANAIEQEDAYIAEVLTAYQDAGILDETLVIVTSDHGQTDILPLDGQHGGLEPEALHIPLLIRGPGVISGEYDTPTHQNTIAPTIAAVMGWEVPSDSSGIILFECLNFSPLQQAIYRINLAEVRLAQATMRLQKTGYSTLFTNQMGQATSFLDSAIGNFTITDYVLAISNAISSEADSQQVLQEAWNLRIQEEVNGRLAIVIAALVITIVFIALIIRRSRSSIGKIARQKSRLSISVLAAFTYFVLLLGILVLVGWRFSPSYLASIVSIFLPSIFTSTLLAFIPSILIFIILQEYLNRRNQAETSTATWAALFTTIVCLTYVSIIIYFIVKNGAGLAWYAKDATEPLIYFFISVSAIAFSVFTITSMLAGLGISRFLRHRKNQ
jgi:hypothetical protein